MAVTIALGMQPQGAFANHTCTYRQINPDVTTITGTSGIDICDGTHGPVDDMEALAGDDVFDGLSGADFIEGNRGADTLFGRAGRDEVNGGHDSDALCGGDGDDDVLDHTQGSDFDHLSDGSGNDIIRMDDLDHNDHWHNEPDGVGEVFLGRDRDDRIVDNSGCHA